MTRSLDLDKRKRLFKFKAQLQKFLNEAQGYSAATLEDDDDSDLLGEEEGMEEEEIITEIEIPHRQLAMPEAVGAYEGRISASERRKRTFERSMEQIEKMLQLEQKDIGKGAKKVDDQ